MTEIDLNKTYPTTHKLTEKQKAFLKYYTSGLNQKEAAIKAGYNPRDAYKRANDLLKKPDFRKYIGRGLKKLTELESREIANDLKITLNVLEKVIDAGTTEDKLNKLATPAHALTALSEKAKLLGMYAPEKSINVSVNVELERAQRLNDLIKEKEKGY